MTGRLWKTKESFPEQKPRCQSHGRNHAPASNEKYRAREQQEQEDLAHKNDGGVAVGLPCRCDAGGQLAIEFHPAKCFSSPVLILRVHVQPYVKKCAAVEVVIVTVFRVATAIDRLALGFTAFSQNLATLGIVGPGAMMGVRKTPQYLFSPKRHMPAEPADTPSKHPLVVFASGD